MNSSLPTPASEAVEMKRRREITMMRAATGFLCLSAAALLILPLPLPFPLRVTVAATDLIAALVVYAVYRQRIRPRS
jgi:hypothetical protein